MGRLTSGTMSRRAGSDKGSKGRGGEEQDAHRVVARCR
jgi:hypothetical protein